MFERVVEDEVETIKEEFEFPILVCDDVDSASDNAVTEVVVSVITSLSVV